MTAPIPIGIAHVAGKYTFPNGSGTQLYDGVTEIYNNGFRTLKLYLTSDYVNDYPLQAVWTGAPTTLAQLAAVPEVAAQITQSFDQFVFTTFTFANGNTNWWQVDPSVSRYQAEYTEMYNLAVYLLTTYNGQAKKFLFQNWEGDWAYMDSFTVDTHVNEWITHQYTAFLGVRQRAIQDARRATPSDCQVLMSFEANRVLDKRQLPHLRRVCQDIAQRIQPDVISYSAYDSLIVQQGFCTSFTDWATQTQPVYTKALQILSLSFPGVALQIGEIGWPQNQTPGGWVGTIGQMATAAYNWSYAVRPDMKRFIYWEIFDNEGTGPNYDGYYIIKPDGTLSSAGNALVTLNT